MSPQTVFPPDVLRELHVRTQGIPRLINAVCDNMLLNSFAQESRMTKLEMLEEVSNDMRLEWPGRRLRGQRGYGDEPYELPAPTTSRRGD